MAAKEKLQEEWRRPDLKPEATYWRISANEKRKPVQEQQQKEREQKRRVELKIDWLKKKMEIEQ